MKATKLANANCTRSRPMVRAALGRAGALCAECVVEGMCSGKRRLHVRFLGLALATSEAQSGRTSTMLHGVAEWKS